MAYAVNRWPTIFFRMARDPDKWGPDKRDLTVLVFWKDGEKESERERERRERERERESTVWSVCLTVITPDYWMVYDLLDIFHNGFSWFAGSLLLLFACLQEVTVWCIRTRSWRNEVRCRGRVVQWCNTPVLCATSPLIPPAKTQKDKHVKRLQYWPFW